MTTADKIAEQADTEPFAGSSRMAAMMRAHEWESSPLGDPKNWPSSLKVIVSLILGSRSPMFLAWGDDLLLLYNDAYAGILGEKHPAALGATLHDVWSEIWSDISPLIDGAMAGEAIWVENLPLRIHRRGYDEDTWFTFSYSPARNNAGDIVGMFCACAETTALMTVEGDLRESEARFRQFSDASSNVLWIRDAQTLGMMFASPAFDRIYGIPGPDRGGDGSLRSWVRLIEPEDRKIVLANFRRVRAGERVDHEFRIRHATTGVLRWIHNADFPLRDAAGDVRWIAGLGADITAAKEAAGRQGVLVAELQHRTRNLLAVVRSLSDRTLSNAASLDDFGKRFQVRLSALSRVQSLLSHLAAGERVTFKELLCAELAAHGATNGTAHKITLDGPSDVPLRSATVQTFALALHELATNAAKYGALETPSGHLFVSWHVEPAAGSDPPRLHVEWRETGVSMPDVNAPARGGGYGRELIERALPYQLKAKTSYELGLDGVRCTIAVPIAGGAGVSGGVFSSE